MCFLLQVIQDDNGNFNLFPNTVFFREELLFQQYLLYLILFPLHQY